MESGVGAPEAMDNAIICLKNVRKVREKGGNRFELQVPSFVIQPGEFIAIVGESGCGKSTLLDMLALVLRPTHAEVFTLRLPKSNTVYPVLSLAEQELAHLRQAGMGYVLQTGGLLPFLTVKENIMLTRRLNGMTEGEEEVYKLVQRLGITEQLAKKPQFLSGGQRQRVAIARALAHHPPMVLADEPTAAVDKHTAREIRNAFKELTQHMGVTVCMVTHDESLVVDAANRTFTFVVRKESAQYTHSTCIEKGSTDAHYSERTPARNR
jgi:putative ABC transport system ATP-binding protein